MSDTMVELRDDGWLQDRMQLLWEQHFADVPRGYPIISRFGSRARNRFGSIAARDRTTLILINRLFADPELPVYVVDGTLVHELAHYAHGFGSGLPRLHEHPHRGGVVEKELEKRGLGELNQKAEQWRKLNWSQFYTTRCDDLLSRRSQKEGRENGYWIAYLKRPDARTITDISERLAHWHQHIGLSDGDAAFRIEWLPATGRQTALSYWYEREDVVRLHGLLSDRRVPESVVDFELIYWLIRLQTGRQWDSITRELNRTGLTSLATEAMQWRKKRWTAFRTRNHPLSATKKK